MKSLVAALVLSASFAFAAQIPRPAPELTFTLPNGQKELLSKHKGKVVLLEFILTTCPHCQDSARVISKLNTELGPRGLQPLAVAINEDADLKGFISQYGVNYPLGKAHRDVAYSFMQHSVMQPGFYVPQVVLIDRTGVIRAQFSGADSFVSSNMEKNFRGAVEKLLNEAPPKSSTSKTPPEKPAKKG